MPPPSAVDVPGPDLPVEVAVEAETPTVLPERVRARDGAAAAAPDPRRRVCRRPCLPRSRRRIVERVAVRRRRSTPSVDPVGAARRRVLVGRIPDGALAARGRRGATSGPAARCRAFPHRCAAAAGTAARRTTLRRVLTAWLAFAERYVAAPIGASWDPHRLEYSFAAAGDPFHGRRRAARGRVRRGNGGLVLVRRRRLAGARRARASPSPPSRSRSR